MTQTKIAVLVSGGGTNLQALIDAQEAGKLTSGRIALVVSNKEGAYALERAAKAGIPVLKRLVEAAGSRVLILPGCGVTPENAARILSETGATEIHASASVVQDGRKVTSSESVEALLKALES